MKVRNPFTATLVDVRGKIHKKRGGTILLISLPKI